MVETNPAHRLYEILVSMRSHGGQGVSVATALDDTVGSPGGQGSVSFEIARANVNALVLDIYNELLALDGAINVQVHMRNIPRWTRMFDLQMAAVFEPDHIATEDELVFLSNLSDILNIKAPEVLPPLSALEDLRTKVNELVESVANADDLDSDLRWLLLKHLRRIWQAIYDVRIRGQKGLEEELGLVIVAAATNTGRWERLKNSQFGAAFRDVINMISRAVKVTDELKQLESGISELFQIEPPDSNSGD